MSKKKLVIFGLWVTLIAAICAICAHTILAVNAQNRVTRALQALLRTAPLYIYGTVTATDPAARTIMIERVNLYQAGGKPLLLTYSVSKFAIIQRQSLVPAENGTYIGLTPRDEIGLEDVAIGEHVRFFVSPDPNNPNSPYPPILTMIVGNPL